MHRRRKDRLCRRLQHVTFATLSAESWWSMSRSPNDIRVAIAGFGAIGKQVAQFVDNGIPGLRLTAVSAKNLEKAQEAAAVLRGPVAIVPVEQIAEHGDVVVECAPAAILPVIAEQTLRAGKHLMVVSSGALFKSLHLVDLARQHGGKITVPTGALLGLDAVRAADLGKIESLTMETRKPIRGLEGAPHFADDPAQITGLSDPKLVFEGTAAQAIEGFPANLNVAVSLGMAGPGPEGVSMRVWADPTVTRNTHTIELKSDSADLVMTIRNIPTDENPRTGRITALSVVAALRRLVDPLVIGS
jgi:aspartate dehydrogenase